MLRPHRADWTILLHIMRRSVPVLLLLLLSIVLPLLGSCSPRREREVRVFAASSLLEPLEAAVREYRRRGAEGPEILLTFAGSQELASQISEGAPADLFLSADERQLHRLQQADIVDEGAEVPLFNNEIVLVLHAAPSSPGAPESQSTGDGRFPAAWLATPAARILMADPAVPLGSYVEEYLNAAVNGGVLLKGQVESIRNNTVSYEPSARLVTVKLAMGAGNGAFLYRSDANALLREHTDREFHIHALEAAPEARYLAVLLPRGRAKKEAREFLHFLSSSKEGGAHFLAHGMSPVDSAGVANVQ